jgi:sec-independent protein translocase protein TatA
MIVIMVVGIMLFGRRLPEVGKVVGRTVVQLRQGLNKLKQEMELDGDVSDIRDSFRGARDSVNKSIEAPRRIFEDPTGLLTDLTDETLAALPTPVADPSRQAATPEARPAGGAAGANEDATGGGNGVV